jgi:hypothetical protein
MSNNNYSAFNALIDIIAAPAKALDEVKSRVAWLWLPLGISIVLAVGAFTFYFSWVDFEWLVDEMVRTLPPGSDPAAAASIRSFMTPTTQIIGATLGIVVMTFLIYLVQAAYLHLVNKVTGEPSLRFGQWFAFTAWTGFPAVFQSLAMLVVILLADSNQLSQYDLVPLSFQSLFIHAEPGSAWANWGNALSLVNVWILGLMTFGFMRWTQSSLAKSLAIVLAPWVLVGGIWALVIA